MTQGEALVRAAQGGDERALEELLAAHLPLVYNVVARALRGHADVDDVVQETMIQVVRGLPGLREPDRLRSWVVAIAFRQVQLHRRGIVRHHPPAREVPEELPDPGGDFVERSLTGLLLTGQRRELAEATVWLDDGDRHLLALWWQEATGQLSRADLAAALGVKANHAAVRVQRMRSQLDAARGLVRALRATPRCPDLAEALESWDGAPGALWRKRLTLRDPGTTGNQVLDSDFFNNHDPAGHGESGVGLAVKFGAGEGNVVRGNRAFDNADDGFDFGDFASPVTVEHNWAYGNGVNRWNVEGWRSNGNGNGFTFGGGSPPAGAGHTVRHNAAWDNVHHGFADGGNPGELRLSNNTAFRNGAVGFAMPATPATLRSNVSIGNDRSVAMGSAAHTSRNTWDEGSWTAAMFRSADADADADAAAAQGARRPDGTLPATDFLTTGNGMGASMSES
ncbi:RNA polymerase sigma factor [Dactylosporangium salmoneum]|uniref:Uncharacterized protein n=1 Tax=Dactylosporangium salmoneum TaxID=53361 RepID=A0ABP5U7V4_9ACTN